MKTKTSDRIAQLGGYAFAEVNKLVDDLKKKGITPIDFGVGDPTIPTPIFIREACKEAIDRRADYGYPSYIGSMSFRLTITHWMASRFRVEISAEKEITTTIGSKEGIFNFAKGFINPGELVIVPTPGYPPYTRGTQFAEGEVFFVPVSAENDFLVDFDAIPKDVAKRAKIIWINYPNSPTGKVAPPEFFKKAIAFGHEHDIIVASDEAYTEIYYGDEPPHSILEFEKEGVVAFNSLSKRSAMTGWRVGWVAGDADIIATFRKVKTNMDSGTPTFIQDAAAIALKDEEHVNEMRAAYKAKRDIMIDALTSLGLPDCTPEATLYIWQRVPEGMSAPDFAKMLLTEDVGIVTTPGNWISDPTADGQNPGEGYVRFALVPSMEQTREAAYKIRNLKI